MGPLVRVCPICRRISTTVPGGCFCHCQAPMPARHAAPARPRARMDPGSAPEAMEPGPAGCARRKATSTAPWARERHETRNRNLHI